MKKTKDVMFQAASLFSQMSQYSIDYEWSKDVHQELGRLIEQRHEALSSDEGKGSAKLSIVKGKSRGSP